MGGRSVGWRVALLCLAYPGWGQSLGLGAGLSANADSRFRQSITLRGEPQRDVLLRANYLRERIGRAKLQTLQVSVGPSWSVTGEDLLRCHLGAGLQLFDASVPAGKDTEKHRDREGFLAFSFGLSGHTRIAPQLSLWWDTATLLAPAGTAGLFLATAQSMSISLGMSYSWGKS